MRRVPLAVCALLAAVVGVAVWFVRDANRFKPVLIAQAEQALGMSIDVRGGLEWRLRPGVGLLASDLHVRHQGRAWVIDRLLLRPQWLSIIRNPTTFANWRIVNVDVDGLSVAVGGGNLRAHRLELRDIGLAGPVPFTAKLAYTRNARAPIRIEFDGAVMFAPRRFRASNLIFKLPHGDGICNLEVLVPTSLAEVRAWPDTQAAVASPAASVPGLAAVSQANSASPQAPGTVRPNRQQAAAQPALLPLDIMRGYDWDGHCEIHRLALASEAVETVRIVLDNKEGGSIVSVRAPSFLGGSARLQMVVRAGQTPVVWEVAPHLAGVDSRRLGAAFGVASVIAAPLNLNGAVGMEGNTAAALASSLDADIRFATGAGTIDVDWLAVPLARIVESQPQAVAAEPATVYGYQTLTGRWRATGERHRLNISLDGASLALAGSYRMLADQLALRGALTLGDSAKRWGLPLPPGVTALPFHFHCGGALGRPDCRLDAQRTFLGGTVDKARAKADEFINSFVPEDYRERARSLLDSLRSQVERSETSPK